MLMYATRAMHYENEWPAMKGSHSLLEITRFCPFRYKEAWSSIRLHVRWFTVRDNLSATALWLTRLQYQRAGTAMHWYGNSIVELTGETDEEKRIHFRGNRMKAPHYVCFSPDHTAIVIIDGADLREAPRSLTLLYPVPYQVSCIIDEFDGEGKSGSVFLMTKCTRASKVYRTLMKQKLHTVLHAARRSSVYTVHPDYSVYTLSML